MPVTALRWRPTGISTTGSQSTATTAATGAAATAAKGRHVLLACDAGGIVRHWHATFGKLLSKITEPGNQIFAADYRNDGYFFATGGKDRLIRLYDESSRGLVATLTGGTPDVTPGHSNRVFSIKFHPRDDNIILSAGWDNTVQVYDVRAGHAVRSLYGPHVCGDALDIDGLTGAIITGSWRASEQLQVWDYGTGQLTSTLPWAPLPSVSSSTGAGAASSGTPVALNSPATGQVTRDGSTISTTTTPGPSTSPASSSAAGTAATQASGGASASASRPRASTLGGAAPAHTMLYSAVYSHGDGSGTSAGAFIAAGGSGANEVRIFDRTAQIKAFASGTPLKACPQPVLVAATVGFQRGK